MQFLKKHYEKIILSLVLLGLGATAVWFYGAVEAARTNTVELPGAPPAKPWVSLDLTKEWNALKAFNQPPVLVLTGEHNLFNPVTWKEMPDGRLIKITVSGPAALKITDISPLYYTIAFDRKAGDSYRLVVTPAVGRSPAPSYYRLNEKDKTKPCIIIGTNDAPDGTTTLTLSIIDTGEVVNVTMKQPYRRIDSYTADMQYPPDNATFSKLHVNQNIRLSDEPYKVFAITNNAVTVQDIRTAQKTPIEWSGH